MLASHSAAFAHFDTPVLVLSLCPDADTARAWDAAVGHPFQHVVWAPDHPPAAAYAALGFTRSLEGVWSEASLGWYAEQAAAGVELHSSRGQDVHQLAGDLVVDAQGCVVLPYYGLDNTDRPSLGTLLRASAIASAGGDSAARQGNLQFVQGYLMGVAAAAPARGDKHTARAATTAAESTSQPADTMNTEAASAAASADGGDGDSEDCVE